MLTLKIPITKRLTFSLIAVFEISTRIGMISCFLTVNTNPPYKHWVEAYLFNSRAIFFSKVTNQTTRSVWYCNCRSFFVQSNSTTWFEQVNSGSQKIRRFRLDRNAPAKYCTARSCILVCVFVHNVHSQLKYVFNAGTGICSDGDDEPRMIIVITWAERMGTASSSCFKRLELFLAWNK